jgi:hypothetical protein
MKNILIQGTSLSVLVTLYHLLANKKEDDKFTPQEANVFAGVIEHHSSLGLTAHSNVAKRLANNASKEERSKFTAAFGAALKVFGAEIEPAEPVEIH